MFQVLPSGFEELFVFDMPDFPIGPTSDIGDKLSEAPIGISLTQLCDGRQYICTRLCIHVSRTNLNYGCVPRAVMLQ